MDGINYIPLNRSRNKKRSALADWILRGGTEPGGAGGQQRRTGGMVLASFGQLLCGVGCAGPRCEPIAPELQRLPGDHGHAQRLLLRQLFVRERDGVSTRR